MPISDAYVVQYLLEGASAVPLRIVWQEGESAGYVATIGDVRVELLSGQSPAGLRSVLRFVWACDEFCIEDPQSGGFLSRRYADEGDRSLADLWCRLNAYEKRDEIRERIYHRLLFGQPESGTAI